MGKHKVLPACYGKFVQTLYNAKVPSESLSVEGRYSSTYYLQDLYFKDKKQLKEQRTYSQIKKSQSSSRINFQTQFRSGNKFVVPKKYLVRDKYRVERMRRIRWLSRC